MARIASKDTQPELRVRSFLHSHGLRYRLHAKYLPGSPDIVFPTAKVCVFVHGCFWHGCPHCIDGKHTVKSNIKYWNQKRAKNRLRDRRTRRALAALGWNVCVIWECETESNVKLSQLLRKIRVRTYQN